MKHPRQPSLEPISAAVFIMISLHAVAILGICYWWSSRNVSEATPRLVWMSPQDFKSHVAEPTKQVATAPPSPARASRPSAPPTKAAPKKAEDASIQKATLVAAPPQQHQMEPVPNPGGAPLFAPSSPATKPPANRSITLRRVPDKPAAYSPYGTPAPPMTSPTLLDVARLNAMRPAPVMPPPLGTAPPPPVEDDAALDAVDEAVNAAFLTAWTAPPIEAVPAEQREARLTISINKEGSVVKSQMSKFSGSHALDESIIEAAAKVKKISAALPANFQKSSYALELNFLLLP